MATPALLLDFVVIGASKSGTSTLFEHLTRHPRIFIPAAKELPFFARDEWYSKGWRWYFMEYFASAPEGSLLGTVTPQYMEDAHRSAQRMHDQLPQAVLIALLRNPIDRAFSSYRMRVQRGRENREFEQVLDDQLAPSAVAAARELPYSIATATDCYLVTSEYGRQLREFLRYYERSQINVGFTEELAIAPQELIDKIMTFLGLDAGFTPRSLGRHFHKGGSSRRLVGVARQASRIELLRWAWSKFPKEHKARLRWWFVTEASVKRRKRKTLVIASSARERLTEFLRSDVQVLETLFGFEVPWRDFRPPSPVANTNEVRPVHKRQR